MKTKQQRNLTINVLSTAANRVWAAGGAVFFLGVAAASAQIYAAPIYAASYAPPAYGDPESDLGYYLSADLGPSFTPDFQSSRLGFPANFSLRPGARFSVGPGYNFLATGKLTLGAEVETGVIANRFSSVTALGSSATFRGQFYQIPLLANLVLKLHPDSFVVPYIGIGGGGDYTLVRLHSPGFFGSSTHNDDTDSAVQGMAGVRFRLNRMSDLGLGYKFLAAFPTEGNYIGTHSVSATFTLRF